MPPSPEKSGTRGFFSLGTRSAPFRSRGFSRRLGKRNKIETETFVERMRNLSTQRGEGERSGRVFCEDRKRGKAQKLKGSKAQRLERGKKLKSSRTTVSVEREGVDPKRVKSSRIRSRREAPGIGRRDGNRPHLVTSFTRNSVLSIVKLSPTTGRPRFAPRSWPFLSRAKSS